MFTHLLKLNLPLCPFFLAKSYVAMRSARALARCRQAVDELEVFLRAINETQRRWAKRIAAQEAKVRRCMIVEDHCREKLRKTVLRFTHEQLKHLVSTDPLGHVDLKLPPHDVFEALHIPMDQISGFAVFVMARIHAFPSCILDVPRLSAIADLLAAWEILPPSKKERYETYADYAKESCGSSRVLSDEKPTSAEGETAIEPVAYQCFLRNGRKQLEASLGPVENAAWMALAPREWESLTLRQKRSYLPCRER
uniref:Uncharacterized protein TCIL3000_10_1490 n=1 Tax=Trypanosoma congolense (strain IL3000) TaxID=1068625 RepID=G0UVH5_TRYCI|nr:unnamed protein product [Trypanosoma congolense IL3000]